MATSPLKGVTLNNDKLTVDGEAVQAEKSLLQYVNELYMLVGSHGTLLYLTFDVAFGCTNKFHRASGDHSGTQCGCADHLILPSRH